MCVCIGVFVCLVCFGIHELMCLNWFFCVSVVVFCVFLLVHFCVCVCVGVFV